MGAIKGETSDGLKPCPFCGSRRVYRHRVLSENTNLIYCMDCGVTTPDFHDVKDAEKIWNRRAEDGE